MPRKPRQYGSSGYMHVIVKGNGGQILFFESRDYKHYLTLLEKHSEETDVTIIAYCLMNNHVHLLIRDTENNVSTLMQKMGISYAWYFNKQSGRAGHVFQGRFYSETIENEDYLLTAYRYILQNPQKAGICSAKRYAWNSYSVEKRPGTFVDASMIRALLGDDAQYEAFLSEEKDDLILFDREPKIKDDRTALETIRRIVPGGDEKALMSIPRDKRQRILLELIMAGVTARQMEQFTGIGRGVVQRTWEKEKKAKKRV